ncbi:pirin family protein [Solitalea longa]|uniref:Pirin family protein n=1 Tax=Solitalea longa TaxID=2079460 RepID=A0A2S5A295_9SPHI|nr:pirin family protein [Solitalea longa]POY36407.1 pirin family protein [Solitalea longa]
MKKNISHLLLGREKNITDTEVVLQPLPHKDFRFANPFIVVHHLRPQTILPGSQEFRIHPHPHRGFAPVTFMLQGQGYHKDNAGHDMVVEGGDVQWMFAGKGLLHSEGPTKEYIQQGGVYELIQIWVNVPKAHKWDAPFYQFARKSELPEVLQQEGVSLRLASGEFEGKVGGMKRSFTAVISIIGEVAKGKTVDFPVKAGYWTLIYVAHGSVTINDLQVVTEHNLIVFEKDGDEIKLTANEDAQLLFLSAEPIDEPVAAKDNFVMNTPEETLQAIEDYKKGVFGTLDY